MRTVVGGSPEGAHRVAGLRSLRLGPLTALCGLNLYAIGNVQ